MYTSCKCRDLFDDNKEEINSSNHYWLTKTLHERQKETTTKQMMKQKPQRQQVDTSSVYWSPPSGMKVFCHSRCFCHRCRSCVLHPFCDMLVCSTRRRYMLSSGWPHMNIETACSRQLPSPDRQTDRQNTHSHAITDFTQKSLQRAQLSLRNITKHNTHVQASVSVIQLTRWRHIHHINWCLCMLYSQHCTPFDALNEGDLLEISSSYLVQKN